MSIQRNSIEEEAGEADEVREHLLRESTSPRGARRRWRDWRFRMYTLGALVLAVGFVVFFLFDMLRKGYPALWQGQVRTSITYTPDRVKNPEKAFPEDVRDLVSPAEVRDVQRNGQSPVVRVTVDYGRSTVEQPGNGIQDVTLTADELPIYMQDAAPIRISRNIMKKLIRPSALDSIQTKLRSSSTSATREEHLTGSNALQQYMISRENNPLPDELQSTVEQLIEADRIQMSFNKQRFGDGKKVERWVVLDSDVDQYLKGHHSKIGNRSRSYEKLMSRLGRKPVPDPDLDNLMSEVRSRVADLKNEREASEQAESQTNTENSINRTKTNRRSGRREDLNVRSTSRLKELVSGWRTARRIDRLRQEGRIKRTFNRFFFLNGDSTEHPEIAGMKSALFGSVMVLLVVLMTAVPIGVMTSVYLEEFAPDNWFTQLIEININNLAAIPSILYGLLGLAVFINTIGLGRSVILVGGLTLSLMTLPIVIISSRSALRSVPDSVRMAGFSMGATRWQVVLHHVLPEALTGILTGGILGLAQAMGETAPLILIGMVGFFPEVPQSFLDQSTVMPAQIFNWWSLPQGAFESRAALAILLLLAVLFLMNGFAVFLRARTQETGS